MMANCVVFMRTLYDDQSMSKYETDLKIFSTMSSFVVFKRYDKYCYDNSDNSANYFKRSHSIISTMRGTNQKNIK